MKKHREEFINKRQEQESETKRAQEQLDAALKRKQDMDDVLTQLGTARDLDWDRAERDDDAAEEEEQRRTRGKPLDLQAVP
jgi:hypothetical protein